MPIKILIVDDSKTIRQQVSFTLNKSGFETLEAGDGQEGLIRIKEHSDIALIISDVNMPNMNGLEMIEKIKELGLCQSTPIIMLTTEGAADLVERAKRSGAKGWLVKPFKPEQLVAVVVKLTS